MIKEKEYLSRRVALAKSLKTNSLVVVLSAKVQTRSNDTEFPYRQNSNFYYLTGFKEDNAALVIKKGKKSIETTLFVQKKDKLLELWTGKRIGVEKAMKTFSVDAVVVIDKFEQKISSFVKMSQNIYYDFEVEDTKIDFLLSQTKHYFSRENLAPLLGKQRLIKSPSEIALIKKALSITKDAHHYAMKDVKKLTNEREVQAGVEYIFKKNGAYSDAYTTIVACGNSANTLHYINNDKELLNGSLILMDAGCEYEYYSSDITRTFPVSGSFSSAQKEIYSLVLEVEKKIISMVRADILRSCLQTKSEELLCKGLVSLGILKGDIKKLLKKKKHKKYYPHGIGHWMGLDVHDVCPYRDKKGKEIPLKEGMVLTIEPGIYIDKDDKSVPKKYRGIGIRIEDDILVTHEGYENLSSGVAKEIDEIEALAHS
jgi:Xaa-Pro aminopeptidase